MLKIFTRTIGLVINLERIKCERKGCEAFFVEAVQETSSTIGRTHFRTSTYIIPKSATEDVITHPTLNLYGMDRIMWCIFYRVYYIVYI